MRNVHHGLGPSDPLIGEQEHGSRGIVAGYTFDTRDFHPLASTGLPDSSYSLSLFPGRLRS